MNEPELAPPNHAEEAWRFISEHPNLTAEDVVTALAGWDNIDLREKIASTIGWLVNNNLIKIDEITLVLIVNPSEQDCFVVQLGVFLLNKIKEKK